MNKAVNTSNDHYLLDGIAEGDSTIIRKVYDSYFKSISTFIGNNKGSADDAKDIFQDAIMIIYNKTKDPEFKLKYTLHTYLYTICRNLWLNKLKKKVNFGVSLEENKTLITDESFHDAILQRDREKLYRRKFAQLGSDCQKVIQFFLEGISMKEIASKMGYSSEAYAKKRKYKCKQKLTRLIESDPLFLELKL